MFENAGCTVLGISFDTPEDNAAFANEHGFPFRLLSDPDKETGTVYEVLRDPDEKFANFPQRHSYLIDPQGKIAKVYAVDDPAGHAAEVLADLEALQR